MKYVWRALFLTLLMNGSPQALIDYDRAYMLGEIKPVSITVSSTQGGVKSPENAFDSQYDSKARVDANEAGEIWLEADLGEVYLIYGVKITGRFYDDYFNAGSHCVADVAAYQGCLATESNIVVSIAGNDGVMAQCGVVVLGQELDIIGQTYLVQCDLKEARYVKLSKDDGHIFVLEVVILTDSLVYPLEDATYTVLVPSMTAQSSTDCCPADRAVDGHLRTASLAAVADGEVWAEFTFPRRSLFSRIGIVYRAYDDWYDPDVNCASSWDSWTACVSLHTGVQVGVVGQGGVEIACETLRLDPERRTMDDRLYWINCADAVGDKIILRKSEGRISVFELFAIGLTTSTPNIGSNGHRALGYNLR